jgi:molybdenum cofactor biosynthesis enzyme MoaA
MGNDSSLQARQATSIEQLSSDIETLNHIAKEKLPLDNFYLQFGIDEHVNDTNVAQKKVDIKIYKVSNEKIEEWRSTSMKTFYKILTRMQLEAAIHAHYSNEKHGDDEDDECPLCMDAQVEISLPCTHSFCQSCIRQWNLTSTTCPSCRRDTNMNNSKYQDQTWVLQDAPLTQAEVAQQIYDFIEQKTNTVANIIKANFHDFL